ncbi:unnamed protein product [Moneuplotes crassus]|uniref:Uncharacterized protein n=1 Tax=Euplotes crassus TaxID=5936 RepID=A0AAD1UES1_EUPCR|nr:unnamed protein product [Moneuplotes crassus]
MNLGCKSPEFYPKYTHYGSDGQGRDSYILKNNGGLCSEPTRPVFKTTMYSKEFPNTVAPPPQKGATSFKYISDGSGRDFYITHNSGGLEAPYIPGTKHSDSHFITSLRSGSKFLGAKRLSTPAERHRMKKCQSAQRLLVQRLTAKSQEWRDISRDNKMRSLSRERELRSPQAAQHNRLMEFQATRNETLQRPMLLYSHMKEASGHHTNVPKMSFPVYARSTRNLNFQDDANPLLFDHSSKIGPQMEMTRVKQNGLKKRKYSVLLSKTPGTLFTKKNSKKQSAAPTPRKNVSTTGKLLGRKRGKNDKIKPTEPKLSRHKAASKLKLQLPGDEDFDKLNHQSATTKNLRKELLNLRKRTIK